MSSHEVGYMGAHYKYGRAPAPPPAVTTITTSNGTKIRYQGNNAARHDEILNIADPKGAKKREEARAEKKRREEKAQREREKRAALEQKSKESYTSRIEFTGGGR